MQDDGEFVSVGDVAPAEVAPETTRNRRTEERTPVRLQIVATLIGAPGKPIIDIVAHNLSRRGIGFTTTYPFVIGEYFVITLHLPGDVSKTLLCRTTYCNPAEGRNRRAGAEFIDVMASNSQGIFPKRWTELAGIKPDTDSAG